MSGRTLSLSLLACGINDTNIQSLAKQMVWTCAFECLHKHMCLWVYTIAVIDTTGALCDECPSPGWQHREGDRGSE